jgi:hypothetical protein
MPLDQRSYRLDQFVVPLVRPPCMERRKYLIAKLVPGGGVEMTSSTAAPSRVTIQEMISNNKPSRCHVVASLVGWSCR